MYGCLAAADADDVRLASNTSAADVDIVRPRGEIDASAKAQGDVVAAGCVVKERAVTARGILEPVVVQSERLGAVGRVEVSVCVGIERQITGSRIEVADGVLLERLEARGRVAPGSAASVVRERLKAGGRVAVAGGVSLERLSACCRVGGAASVGKELENRWPCCPSRCYYLAQ